MLDSSITLFCAYARGVEEYCYNDRCRACNTFNRCLVFNDNDRREVGRLFICCMTVDLPTSNGLWYPFTGVEAPQMTARYCTDVLAGIGEW